MHTTCRTAFVTVLGLWIACSGFVHAQVNLGAGLDLEYRTGGEASRFIVNEIPSAAHEPHFALHQLNLFAFSDIGRGFHFESRLQIDNIGDGDLNPLRLGLAYLGWEPESNSLSVLAGRMVNPFGLHSKHVLAFQSDFVAAPLPYGYGVNVTQHLGYWPGARTNTAGYTEWEVGLSSLYRTGYVTGGMASWTIAENTLVWDVAVTNSAPPSRGTILGSGGMGGITRVEYRPAVFWTQGISLSHGTFMEERPENTDLRQQGSLSDYRQTLIGTDVRAGYGFFEVKGEFIYTIWSVPRFQGGSFAVDAQGEPVEYRLTSRGGYLDAKFEPPFAPGSYIAVRGERLQFPNRDDPVTGATFQWDDDVTRLSAVLGYKLHPQILTKISFTEQTPFDGSTSSFRIQVTSMF